MTVYWSSLCIIFPSTEYSIYKLWGRGGTHRKTNPNSADLSSVHHLIFKIILVTFLPWTFRNWLSSAFILTLLSFIFDLCFLPWVISQLINSPIWGGHVLACGSSWGQGSNLHYSSHPSCCSDNTRSLTHCTNREFQFLYLLRRQNNVSHYRSFKGEKNRKELNYCSKCQCQLNPGPSTSLSTALGRKTTDTEPTPANLRDEDNSAKPGCRYASEYTWAHHACEVPDSLASKEYSSAFSSWLIICP